MSHDHEPSLSDLLLNHNARGPLSLHRSISDAGLRQYVLPCSGANTRSFFSTRSSFMRSRCPRKWSLFLMSTEDTLCCLANLRIAVFLFSRKDTPRIILRHFITKLCIRFCCGTVSAAHSRPYISTGTMTVLNRQILVCHLPLRWYHKTLLSELKALDVLLLQQ